MLFLSINTFKLRNAFCQVSSLAVRRAVSVCLCGCMHLVHTVHYTTLHLAVKQKACHNAMIGSIPALQNQRWTDSGFLRPMFITLCEYNENPNTDF